jgi:hypothetical protein
MVEMGYGGNGLGPAETSGFDPAGARPTRMDDSDGGGQVLGTHGEIVRRLKVLGEGRLRHNKALLHALLPPAMQPGLPLGPLGPPGPPAMHDASGGAGHKGGGGADFRAPQPRMLVPPAAPLPCLLARAP